MVDKSLLSQIFKHANLYCATDFDEATGFLPLAKEFASLESVSASGRRGNRMTWHQALLNFSCFHKKSPIKGA